MITNTKLGQFGHAWLKVKNSRFRTHTHILDYKTRVEIKCHCSWT